MLSVGYAHPVTFEEIYQCPQAALLILFIIFFLAEINAVFDYIVTHNVFYKAYCSFIKNKRLVKEIPDLSDLLIEKMYEILLF